MMAQCDARGQMQLGRPVRAASQVPRALRRARCVAVQTDRRWCSSAADRRPGASSALLEFKVRTPCTPRSITRPAQRFARASAAPEDGAAPAAAEAAPAPAAGLAPAPGKAAPSPADVDAALVTLRAAAKDASNAPAKKVLDAMRLVERAKPQVRSVCFVGGRAVCVWEGRAGGEKSEGCIYTHTHTHVTYTYILHTQRTTNPTHCAHPWAGHRLALSARRQVAQQYPALAPGVHC